MKNRPPGVTRTSTFQTIGIIARYGLKRWKNKISEQFSGAMGSKKKTGKSKAGRSAMIKILMPFFAVLYILVFILSTTMFITRLQGVYLRDICKAEGKILVVRGLHRFLSAREHLLDEIHDPDTTVLRNMDGDNKAKIRLKEELETYAAHHLSSRKWKKMGIPDSPEARSAHLTRIYRGFLDRGIEGFEPGPLDFEGWPSTHMWRENTATHLVDFLGLLLAFLFFCLLLVYLGTGNQDLGKVEWNMEWLFTFPASGSAIFLAKAIEYTFSTAFSWLIIFPVLFVFYWVSGYMWWALPLALAMTVFMNFLIGLSRQLSETWLRRKYSLGKLKNFQAGFTICGMLMMFTVLTAVFSTFDFDFIAGIPPAVFHLTRFLPFSAPALLCLGAGEILVALGILAVSAVAAPWLCVFCCNRLVRDGLLTDSNVLKGERKKLLTSDLNDRPARIAEFRKVMKRGVFMGIVGKEIRLLLRDRNFMVQTLFIPAIITAYNVLLNPPLIEGVKNNFYHAGALAFGIGSYVLIFGGASVLNAEGKSLWLLYTFPASLKDIMLRKAKMWGIISSSYCLVPLGIFFWLNPRFDGDLIPAALMALAGVVIYSFVASGIGVLATNPTEELHQRKMRPGPLYLYMFLSGLYVFAFYADSAWTRIVLLVICSLMAVSIWQKVVERLPYLLDPDGAPRARIGLAEGMMATLAFLVLQELFFHLYSATISLDIGNIRMLSYFSSGLVVSVFSLGIMKLWKYTDILEDIGLGTLRRTSSPGMLKMRIRPTVLWTALTVTVGTGYLFVLQGTGLLSDLSDKADTGFLKVNSIPFFIIAVLLAPVFEEFIFRGILFSGMKRILNLPCAILGSAAIFALIHPASSFVPVLVLGIATAAVFNRTRSIYCPMLVHMAYNTAVVFIRVSVIG